MRPRLTEDELQLISYCLLVNNRLAHFKRKEVESLPFELRRFARRVHYTGDFREWKVFEEFREHVGVELSKDLCPLERDTRLLRRRVEGWLNGKRYHSISTKSV